MDSHSPVGACTMAGTGVAGTPMIADMADEMEKEANKALEDIETKGSFSKLPGFTPWSQEHGLVGWRFLWKYEDDDSETFWAHVTGWLPATLNDGRDYWQAKGNRLASYHVRGGKNRRRTCTELQAWFS